MNAGRVRFLKVLLIDDTLDLRELLRDFLESLDHSVLEAGGGEEALSIAINEKPDLVITDLFIPDLNGVDLIRSLKKRDRRLPIIAISGYQDELLQVERLGVLATLSKPPNFSELKTLLDHLDQKLSA